MFSVAEWLDRAKSASGASTDYRLAKMTGLTTQALSMYRTGHRMPDERAILELCKLSGDDPDYVAVCIQAMRAANDDAAGLWRHIADRLNKGVAVVLPAAIVAIFFALSMPMEADARPALSALSVSSLCVMSNVIWRLLWRVGHLWRRRQLAAA